MTTETERSIYDLDLHESVSVDDGMYHITRVPGGWLYERWRWVKDEDYEPFAVVFVPFDNGFQPRNTT